MQAAVFTDYCEPLEIRDVEKPTFNPEGVIVRVEACGICRSDWHGWQNDYDFEFEDGHIMGHEPAGRIVEVGDDVENFREGDHVAIPFNLSDGSCQMCRTGHSNICDNGASLGFLPDLPGAWAEEVHIPNADHNVVHLPDDVSSVDMAGLGCRFMTAFHGLVHKADLGPGDWVAVHGCGGVGLSAIHIADALGGNVIAVDLFDEKLSLAKELGAQITVNASEVNDIPSEVHSISNGGADIAVDALGIATTCRNSVRCLGKLGQHIQIGLTTSEEAGEISIPTDMIVQNEIEFIGSHGMQPARYNEIFHMIEAGKLDPSLVISEKVSLNDVSEKLYKMNNYETIGIPVINKF